MKESDIQQGTIHAVPSDIEVVLVQNPDILEKRNSLTPLARNEWICRVTIVKKEETRKEHIERLCEEVGNGKKRPCCRPGCPHYRESAKKWFPSMKDV
jgi:uncharacterized protein YdeI (YjbR/CyaY-like superfamily)